MNNCDSISRSGSKGNFSNLDQKVDRYIAGIQRNLETIEKMKELRDRMEYQSAKYGSEKK